MTFAIFQDLKRWRFWRHFSEKALAAGGLMSAFLQLHSVIFPLDKTFQGNHTFLAVAGISLLSAGILAWPRPIEEVYSSPKTRIRILKGNLLTQDKHLVIGTCDTFDVETPVIIAEDSLQGQALRHLFGGDVNELSQQLAAALHGTPVLGTIHKAGKQDKYEVGTVATLKQAGRRLFFLAYCEMDATNQARGTVDGVWKSLLALWEAISMHGNGAAVSIPVIGGGQARLSSVLPAQDSIRFIALSFIMASRRERICEELRIIVQPKDYEKLDRLELQSFLSSLRPS
jgi:hypothetical protein